MVGIIVETQIYTNSCADILSKEEGQYHLHQIKHPLEKPWSFWLFTNQTKVWEKNLVELTTFDTVEDYWCLYHHMKLPSELSLGQDYMVFKRGIQPMWEDVANKKGGRWFINLDKRTAAEIDRIWLDVVLLLIGANFVHSDIICGVVVNVRSKSKISVWTRNTDQQANLEIGKKLKHQIKIHFKLHFYIHNSSNALYSE